MAEKEVLKDLLEDEIKDLYSARSNSPKPFRKWQRDRMIPLFRMRLKGT